MTTLWKSSHLRSMSSTVLYSRKKKKKWYFLRQLLTSTINSLVNKSEKNGFFCASVHVNKEEQEEKSGSGREGEGSRGVSEPSLFVVLLWTQKGNVISVASSIRTKHTHDMCLSSSERTDKRRVLMCMYADWMSVTVSLLDDEQMKRCPAGEIIFKMCVFSLCASYSSFIAVQRAVRYTHRDTAGVKRKEQQKVC